jgi:hypothetical protein
MSETWEPVTAGAETIDPPAPPAPAVPEPEEVMGDSGMVGVPWRSFPYPTDLHFCGFDVF